MVLEPPFHRNFPTPVRPSATTSHANRTPPLMVKNSAVDQPFSLYTWSPGSADAGPISDVAVKAAATPATVAEYRSARRTIPLMRLKDMGTAHRRNIFHQPSSVNLISIPAIILAVEFQTKFGAMGCPGVSTVEARWRIRRVLPCAHPDVRERIKDPVRQQRCPVLNRPGHLCLSEQMVRIPLTAAGCAPSRSAGPGWCPRRSA